MRRRPLSSGSPDARPSLNRVRRHLWASHLRGDENERGTGLGAVGGRPARVRAPRGEAPGQPWGGPHGLRYSTQLLSVCFRPMMMAICRNRSIMQPLRWHCGGRAGGQAREAGLRDRGACGEGGERQNGKVSRTD